MTSRPSPRPRFRVLFVCTANICRSPMAERLFAVRLAADAPVAVASAGVTALTGHEMDALSAMALRDLGVGGDAGEHVARPATPELLDANDLILTATTSQRARVIEQLPAVYRRTFTLREFGRLTAGLPVGPGRDVETLRARVAEAAARRGFVEPVGAGADEIGDPFGAPYAEMLACAQRIDIAVRDVAAALGVADGAVDVGTDEQPVVD